MEGLAAAATAAAVDALDDLVLLHLGLGDAADARGAKVGVARLDAPEAAQVFKPGLSGKKQS